MRVWEKYIRDVVPYVPGEQPQGDGLIKLNTNENPYPPAPGVQRALTGLAADYDRLRKYPDPASAALVKVLADYHGLNENRIFVGVGSDDVIAMAFLTFFNADQPILFPDVSYSFYQVWADLYRIPYRMPELDEQYLIKKEDYYRENGGVIFPNPNAPTGIFMPLAEVKDILDHNQDVIVIVDEAYIDFGGESAEVLLADYDNLLVVRTFSKSRSMAGIRIGYAMGHERLIQALNDVKYSYNSYTMNLPSLVLGSEAVKDDAYFRQRIGQIISTREWSMRRFGELGFHCLDSMANFLFVTHPQRSAQELSQQLKKENIYVRYFNKPRLDRYLRISIGTDEEMEQLFQVLEMLINAE